jgi:Antitoxin Xre/MbcA/ParS C-terminal toxin-binding domain
MQNTESKPRLRGTAQPREVSAEQQRQAMIGFFRIMELWNAGNAAMRRVLGSPPERTFYEWKSGRARRMPDDTLRRIGYVAGIYKALQILYADPSQADGWVQQPNRFFGGQTPLERMAAGDVTDLAAVRAYVDAARTPWS